MIKVGGRNLDSARDLRTLCEFLISMGDEADGVMLVHGASPDLDALSGAIGSADQISGGRWGEVEASMMVLCGLVNKRLVGCLSQGGLAALGFCGLDCGVLKTNFLNLDRLGRVGGPPRVSSTIISQFLANKVIPVVAPICQGPDGGPVLVAADTVAHAIAAALGAGKLIFICDEPGITDQRGAVVEQLTKDRAYQLLQGARVAGELIPKVHAALAALAAGVGRVLIGNLESLSAGTATEVIA